MLHRIYKVIRFVIVLALLIVAVVPAVLYVGLSLPGVQNYARREAGERLSELLGAKVEVGNLAITPFNRATLRNVSMVDSVGDTIAKATRIGAGFGLTDFLLHGHIVLNYVEAVGLDLRVSRDSAGTPLNIDAIIARLNKPGGDGGVPDLLINTIIIRRSRISYDVLSAVPKPLGEFDASHITVKDFRADLRLEFVKDKREIMVDLRRMGANETRSGLVLTDIATKLILHKAPAPSGAVSTIDIKGLEIEMPGSRVLLSPTVLNLNAEASSEIGILPGSHIRIADLSPFLSQSLQSRLGKIKDARIDMIIDAALSRHVLDVSRLSIACGNGAIRIDAPDGAGVRGLDSTSTAAFAIPKLNVSVNPGASLLLPFPGFESDSVSMSILPLTASVKAEGDVRQGKVSVDFDSRNLGKASIALDYGLSTDYKLMKLEGLLSTTRLGISGIAGVVEKAMGRVTSLPGKLPRSLTSTIEWQANFRPGQKIPEGSLLASVAKIELLKRDGSPASLSDITLDVSNERGYIDASLESANDGFALDLDINADIASRSGSFALTLDDLDLSLKGNQHLSLTAIGQLALQPSGSPLPATGLVSLNNILFQNPDDRLHQLALSNVDISASIPADTISEPEILLTSDIFNASLTGSVNPSTLLTDIKELTSCVVPLIFEKVPSKSQSTQTCNDFNLKARLLTTAPIENFIKLPVQVRYPIDFQINLNTTDHLFEAFVNAPYLWQGNKEIDSTKISLKLAGSAFDLNATTRMPSKNGMMDLNLVSSLPSIMEVNDSMRSMATQLSWKVDAQRNFSGLVDLNIFADRHPENSRDIVTVIDFNPSELIFNDTVWTMNSSRVSVSKERVTVDGFRVGRPGQYVEIDGAVTASHNDSLCVKLADVDLDYVFETLNIPNAMFGGTASGKLYASGLLGKEFAAYTPDLFVKGLKYNFSLMGDTHIKAWFDPDVPAINIDARVNQPNGCFSYINGYIKPTSEGYIDLDFNADKIEVGFMKPFMSAFASAVHGYASGKAHLFGTFHDINMSGDIYAQDLSLTLDFTGTTYWATDSVHLTPGNIDLKGITLRDREGHTANLSGYLHHTNFHEPRFQFRITDADDLLVYDLPESPERRWFGTIYGDGSATVTGVPGKIDIGVNMITAPRSSFTFVLSDAEEAYDYNFITFRDRNRIGVDPELSDALINGLPSEVAEMRRALAKKIEEESSSIYDMAISVTVNPNAMLTVVMDPVGGDAIRARGNGALTMTYNSASEDLGLRGDYTLDNGTYNFTFQDIIRKDFRINPGSTIRFTGDPYAAQLDIEAAYRLTANLSDLDESFLDDPELTRTSVPVDALINVTGDMRSPEIAYDFAFPTLKDDVKRKVNSIVSTDDMRARQMLYLLALNRFYTPEYMSATRGNELFSVASSTIASQIGNLLGSLSDNWTIAPNLRSDKGDFSDVEFDLALSSSLLNNRLLFNGNFGYRDKSLNNNTFIGDFDLEYLLNNSGTLRLKAYNRYNDQNFYVKNALTTQGVGIVFRRDFDSFTSWLKALRRKKTVETDSIKR